MTQQETTTTELPADKLLNALAESSGQELMASQEETLHALVQVLSEEGIVPEDDQEQLVLRALLLADMQHMVREGETTRATSAPGEQHQSKCQHSAQSSGGLPLGIDTYSPPAEYGHQMSMGHSTS